MYTSMFILDEKICLLELLPATAATLPALHIYVELALTAVHEEPLRGLITHLQLPSDTIGDGFQIMCSFPPLNTVSNVVNTIVVDKFERFRK
jgi:hypothetical protein